METSIKSHVPYTSNGSAHHGEELLPLHLRLIVQVSGLDHVLQGLRREAENHPLLTNVVQSHLVTTDLLWLLCPHHLQQSGMSQLSFLTATPSPATPEGQTKNIK